jgi:thiopeptide-type bacteriocin biosynthesis protein
MPLGEALRSRWSCREFEPRPLDLPAVSSLLAAAAGVLDEPPDAGVPRRTYPSAGAVYCINAYLVALRVEGLAEGVYRYQAEDHTVHRVELASEPLRERLKEMLGVQGFDSGLGAAAAFLLLSARLPSITSRYGARGYRFALQESGHIAQNLLLAAAAQGLGALPLGSFLDDCAGEVIGALAEEEPVVYAVALGHARTPPHRDAIAYAPPERWLQWRLSTSSPKALLAGPLSLALTTLEEQGDLLGFWFMVKAEGGSHVRLRVLPGQTSAAEVSERLSRAFTEAQQQEQLTRVKATVYEPEVFLFGGPRGMELFHTLFCLDSRLVIEALRVERRLSAQLSQMWTELLLRSAGLDAFERWDVWKRVGQVRPAASSQMGPLLSKMRPALQALAGAATSQLRERIEAAAPSCAPLCARLEGWGEELRVAHREGALERGVRQMLAAAVVFHWNRMMYELREQVFLARLWQEATEPSS